MEPPLPERVVIPLRQSLGAPAAPCVSVGDEVRIGQKIGEAQGFVSVPVHASIAGTVSAVGRFPHPVGGEQDAILSSFYEDALAAMRAAEEEVGAPQRLFFFEPGVAWAEVGLPAPPPFEHDDRVVYSPHIYQEGISPGSLEEGFLRAADEAASLYKGAPVVTGEWGSDPNRAADPEDDYFERHLSEQDRYRYGATLWTWREACGDPHKYNDTRDGRVPMVYGFFEVDCESNTIDGERNALVDVMQRMAVRFAPGPLGEVTWSPDDSRLQVEGDEAPEGNRLEVFVPTSEPSTVQVEASGLGPVEATPWHGGTLFHALAAGGAWSIDLRR